MSVMTCGLPTASSLMVIDAEREPGALGENVTVTAQLLPAAIAVPQVFV